MSEREPMTRFEEAIFFVSYLWTTLFALLVLAVGAMAFVIILAIHAGELPIRLRVGAPPVAQHCEGCRCDGREKNK